MKARHVAWGLALACAPLMAQTVKGHGEDFQAALWGASCMACHGTDGQAGSTGLTIGGRQADELYGILLAYKTGGRPGTIMHQHAKGYSDAELKRIAVYFSQLK